MQKALEHPLLWRIGELHLMLLLMGPQASRGLTVEGTAIHHRMVMWEWGLARAQAAGVHRHDCPLHLPLVGTR